MSLGDRYGRIFSEGIITNNKTVSDLNPQAQRKRSVFDTGSPNREKIRSNAFD
jgi:hypothetical protein